jgi:hypothetical protein
MYPLMGKQRSLDERMTEYKRKMEALELKKQKKDIEEKIKKLKGKK